MAISRIAMLFILTAVSGLADVIIANPSFSTPTIVCTLGYAYNDSGDCNGIFPTTGVPNV